MSRVGIVGCGVIAPTYADTLGKLGTVELVACADALPERAAAFADGRGARAGTIEELLTSDDLDAVVNLTPPRVHAAVTRAALEAGRSVFSEKPLAIDLAEGRDLVQRAAEHGLRLGCAPDTFLGSGLQTARDAIDRGLIGEPLAANATMLQGGPERWHPDPDFFYQRGAGPLFDMGPYYVTALVQLLGPARTVTGGARISRPQRTIASGARRGEQIDVEVPTHVTSVIEHVSGPLTTLVVSFDVLDSRAAIEVYGSEGILAVPDPNTFGGPVRIRSAGSLEWSELPLVDTHLPQQRGIGLAEMLWAQRAGRPHRASPDLALHVLEVMEGTLVAAEHGRRVDLTTTCRRAPLLPVGPATNPFDD